MKRCFVVVTFTMLFISSLFVQNHIEKRYWDNYKLRIREVYEALPDGTYNGYRKCYNWDGIQDLNFLYKKGTMVKKQEFAKDGKTVVAELNADDDGNFHGMQFAKSFFTPGVASYNIKATMNHGEITTLQRFNENGKILDIQANKVKSFEKGILTDDYLFSRETKLITGNIVEDQEKLIIKEGKIDSVFSKKNNQLIAFKDQDGLLVVQSVENGIFIEKKSINDMSLKAQIEFTTTFDVTFNGAYEYGIKYTNLWDKTKNKLNLQYVKEYGWNGNQKGNLLTEVDYTDAALIKKKYYSENGNLIKYRHYKVQGNRTIWIEYDFDGNEINSLLKQEDSLRRVEERKRFIKDSIEQNRVWQERYDLEQIEKQNQAKRDSIEQVRIKQEKIKQEELQKIEKQNQAIVDSISMSLKNHLSKYFTESGYKNFMGDSGFYKFCLASRPEEIKMRNLFTDSNFTIWYLNSINLYKYEPFENPDKNNAYEYISKYPPQSKHLMFDVEEVIELKPINNRVDKNLLSYNYVYNNLKKGIKVLQIKLEGYDWSSQFSFLKELRWVWIENNWYCITTGE